MWWRIYCGSYINVGCGYSYILLFLSPLIFSIHNPIILNCNFITHTSHTFLFLPYTQLKSSYKSGQHKWNKLEDIWPPPTECKVFCLINYYRTLLESRAFLNSSWSHEKILCECAKEVTLFVFISSLWSKNDMLLQCDGSAWLRVWRW